MKELEKEFIGKGEVSGYSFRQIDKTEHAYLYEVNGEYYEVFERKVNSQFNCVSYPSSKAFGSWAYYIANLAKAKLKLQELTERVCVRTSRDSNTNSA